MEILSLLGQGFVVASTPLNIALLLMGCFIGTLLGALPGLGPVNGVAVLIPLTFTFGFDATSSMILLCAVYFGCMYGGRISSILLNIPGDEPAIMTTLDGYPMAVQGQAANALAISGVASFVGSTIAVIGLSLFRTHPRARSDPFRPRPTTSPFISSPSPPSAAIAGVDPRKTLLSALIGLTLATVGLDPESRACRATPSTVSTFMTGDRADRGPCRPFRDLGNPDLARKDAQGPAQGHPRGQLAAANGARSGARGRRCCRGSGVGFVAGVLPWRGRLAGVPFMAYVAEKQWGPNKKGTFGKGDPPRRRRPRSRQQLGLGIGALIHRCCSLGVPGSGTTAVLLAMLISLNVQPGPLLFERQPDLVWGLVASLYMANVALLILNLPMIGIFTRLDDDAHMGAHADRGPPSPSSASTASRIPSSTSR